MPKSKDLKRLVRQRAAKTGESYTAARAQILARPREQSMPSDERLAELAGTSNETVEARTGRTWRQWVRELDAIDAASMTHAEIAKRVKAMADISGWWSQSVTVGYERIRGLREIGQRRGDKSFEATKSKTLPVPVSKLYQAFASKRVRERWLPGVDLTIRTRIEDKSMRITWPDGTSVHAYFVAKGEGKSQVAVAHVGLADKQDAAARKEYWAGRLDALAEIL
jgi:hypothetical protein